jgi:hypothetical protein
LIGKRSAESLLTKLAVSSLNGRSEKMEFCDPHKDRGFFVAAAKEVAGTPMCDACFLGKPVSAEELSGELGDTRGLEANRRYYEANRKKVLETHRRWREAKKSRTRILCSQT